MKGGELRGKAPKVGSNTREPHCSRLEFRGDNWNIYYYSLWPLPRLERNANPLVPRLSSREDFDSD